MSGQYHRIIYPYEGESGGFIGKVLELHGCYTQGETVEETYANLDEMIEMYIKDCAEWGYPALSPMTDEEVYHLVKEVSDGRRKHTDKKDGPREGNF